MAQTIGSSVKAAILLTLILFLRCVGCAAQSIVQQPLDSPRLQSLKIELDREGVGVLEAFWKEIERTGTPLVEGIKGDDKNLLVTFIRRAKEENKYFAIFPM